MANQAQSATQDYIGRKARGPGGGSPKTVQSRNECVRARWQWRWRREKSFSDEQARHRNRVTVTRDLGGAGRFPRSTKRRPGVKSREVRLIQPL